MTLVRDLKGLLLGLFALTGLSAPALAQEPTAAPIPQAWIAYAETVSGDIARFLGDESPSSSAFRGHLDATRTAPDQPTPDLLLKVRIADDGVISAVDFAPFAAAAANESLRSALVGRRLAPPPAGMRQPLRLAIQLEPAAEPAEAKPATVVGRDSI